MWTRFFWTSTLERAVKTAAQVALVVVGQDRLFNAVTADWANILSFSLGGFVLSILTSLASSTVGSEDSPSLID